MASDGYISKCSVPSRSNQVTWPVITEVWSESSGLFTERRRDIGMLCAVTHVFAYWMSRSYLPSLIVFIVGCGIARFLCTMCVLCTCSTFGHHPHPLVYPCAKFRFCCTLHCWASPLRKIVYSLPQSPSLFDSSVTEAFALEFLTFGHSGAQGWVSKSVRMSEIKNVH